MAPVPAVRNLLLSHLDVPAAWQPDPNYALAFQRCFPPHRASPSTMAVTTEGFQASITPRSRGESVFAMNRPPPLEFVQALQPRRKATTIAKRAQPRP